MTSCPAPNRGIFDKITDCIDEKTFFTCISTITFVTIGVFIYILNAYTYFDKIRIKPCSTPKAPFGHLKNVIFHNSTWYSVLLKHYRRLKSKGIKIGGLYLFFKPAVLITDMKLIEKLIQQSQTQKIELTAHLSRLDMENIKSEFDEVLSKGCSNETFSRFFIKLSKEIFGFSMDETSLINATKEKTSSGFKYYFGLAYWCFKYKNYYLQIKQAIQKELEYRKKNDLKYNDVIQNISSIVDEDIISHISEVYLEYMIFSTHSLILCLYEVSKDDRIQEELIKEIRRFTTKTKVLHLEDLEHLPYMEAIVKETFRKYPPVPVAVERNRNIIEGLNKDILLLVPVFAIQHDIEYYLDPNNFDPDRFLEDNVNNTLFMPFGLGTRRNVGYHLTTISLKLCLFWIFSKYKVTVDQKYTLEFDQSKVNIQPKKAVPLYFHPIS